MFTQLNLFDNLKQNNLQRQLLYDLFQAYYDARRNKRNTPNVLKFEQNYESKLFELYQEIISKTYKIKTAVCFINYKPVQREIFAADFSDRIVHHLVYNYISPIFERIFINDSYSCRIGKGTSYGIKRINKFIRSCSNNYQNNCYILRLDIKGYFMAINRQLLFDKTKHIIDKFSNRKFKTKDNTIVKWNQVFDFDIVTFLLKIIIFNNPVDNYIRKGNINNWNGLPPSKSLFYSDNGCGLPIGNLTSQLFSNIYLNDFDHWIKHQQKCKFYGRYVDDFIIIHEDKEFLKSLIPRISNYLKDELMLELHPNKIYLQHFSKGVKFLGAVIKPYRIYIANRTKGNFFKAINEQNRIVGNHKPSKVDKKVFLSSMNSYFGIMQQYKTYKLRKQMILSNLSACWWNYFYLSKGIRKFIIKQK